MALFTWPFPKNPSAAPLLGVMALAVALAAVILLAVGLFNLQVNLETRQVELEVRTAQAQSVASDKAALLALYNATAGSSWSTNTNWDSDEPLEDWHGVTTDANGRVFSVILNNNNLDGTLPADLGNLSRIQTLSLYDNSLSGSIPAELGNLSNLTALPLYNNSLSGSIPAELGSLSNLRTLNLSRNDLTGSIPVELGNLNSATLLSLDRNSLDGTIPSELGNLSNMVTLTLYDNSLEGTVPTELGNLSRMVRLRLKNNSLTGQLPASLTGISTLTTLTFQNNEGLCAPLDNSFQAWLDALAETNGPDCPSTRIWSGATVPVVGEPVFVELTTREHRLARINVTQAEYDADPCIGYDTNRGIEIGWVWEHSDTSSSTPWFDVPTAGKQPHATFAFTPQSNQVGKYLRARMTVDSTEHVAGPIGPVVADHGVASGDQVSVSAPFVLSAGTVTVGEVLVVGLSTVAQSAEREDPAINPRPDPWQWERSDDGSTGWTNVTPYHEYCDGPDFHYPLTTEDEGKHLRSHVYYNDDSSGSVVLKRAETASSAGPVGP